VSFSSSLSQVFFRWTPGIGYQILGSSGSSANAWAINASGTVVGTGRLGGIYKALLYADGLGLVDLNTLINPANGWFLMAALDINDAGQIVGYGTVMPSGATHAFRLDPSPAPSLVIAGGGCASGAPPFLSSTVPHLAQALTLTVTQAQPGLAGQIVVSNIPAASLSLGGGCVAYVDVANFVPLVPFGTDAAGSWLTTMPIPNAPFLIGAQFALQAVLYPTSSPLGADLTNGLFATIGN
jgi:probable HAF family extracellular repeat protein